MSNLKAILFDFDGTIADTTQGITATMVATFKEMQLPIPAEQDMINTIGLPLFKAMQMLNNLSDKEAQEAVNTYARLFPIYEAKLVKIFPEVKETLQWLADEGIRMAIVTSRNVESLDLIMSTRGIDKFFETRITHSDGCAPKPAPDMVLALLERMNLTADEVLVVGDTTFDIGMGNSAGCRTVAVTYGNHSLERLLEASPTHIIHSFDSLKSIILAEK